MKNTLKAMKMSEQELSMVNGGAWSLIDAEEILDECIRNENHSCTRDGIKISLNLNGDVPIEGELRDFLIYTVQYAETGVEFTSENKKASIFDMETGIGISYAKEKY